jgi:hypothetical protein
MSDQIEFTVRAPAFQRLVNNVYNFTRSEPEKLFGPVDFIGSLPYPKEESDIECKIIASMVREMNNSSAWPIFPVEDVDMLAKIFIRVARVYSSAPEIYGKINLCWAAQKIGSLLMPSINMSSANKRATEIKDLNKNFYDLNMLIIDKEVDVSGEFIEVENHEFHPESQFIRFTCKIRE